MKIDRLIGILSILLQKETVTAPALAEQFEVSRRTISRDIDALCQAGIPIITRQGTNGGISIMKNFRIDRTLLTKSEMKDILAGLRSLDSVNGTNRYGQLMEKLSAGSSDFMTGDQSVLINLSSWYKDTLAPKIELIRKAIDKCLFLEFQYYAPGGEGHRRIEPYYLIFCWSSWYIWGWCTQKENYRLFKLNRMDALILDEANTFEKRPAPYPDLSNERIFPGGIRVKALFDKECKWRLIEEFGSGCFEELQNGQLLFHADYTNKENLISWLLTFGEKAELLEPEFLREELGETIRKMSDLYTIDSKHGHDETAETKKYLSYRKGEHYGIRLQKGI
ncbi:MAG TPA: YafY family transcriptional regulator [Candidatus Mediterraneibacter surreyensis]|nr:YafY family transcriptional regulator [Candidatus Mediterraneibacter surreyensis]